MSTTALTDTIEVIERSVFHAIRQEVVDKGYYPDTSALIEDNIIALNQPAKTFTIALNRTSYYTVGRIFNIKTSTGNNGTYTVVSSVFTTPNTIITVAEVIPNPTVDGKTSIYKYYDDTAGVALLKTDIDTIITSKGYAIEVYGVSAPRSKYQKKIPRIVITKNQFLPGSLGGGPDRVYFPVGSNPLAPTSFTAKVLPPQTVDYNIDIHLVSNSAAQSRVLHAILALAIPKRGYVQVYNDSNIRFFTVQYSYREIPDNEDNINEDIYMYSIRDIFESESPTVQEGIIPITEITVDKRIGTEDNNIQGPITVIIPGP